MSALITVAFGFFATVQGSDVRLTADQVAAVLRAYMQDGKIAAIKLLRSYFLDKDEKILLGLREAKDFVDELDAMLGGRQAALDKAYAEGRKFASGDVSHIEDENKRLRSRVQELERTVSYEREQKSKELAREVQITLSAVLNARKNLDELVNGLNDKMADQIYNLNHGR